MKLRLHVTLAPGDSSVFEHAGPTIRIGRDPAGELVIQGDASQSVSWNHARIDLTPDGASINDLGSTNGTLVNDQRLAGRRPLIRGDMIQLGHTGPVLEVVALDLFGGIAPARPAAIRAATVPVPFPHPPESMYAAVGPPSQPMALAESAPHFLQAPAGDSSHQRSLILAIAALLLVLVTGVIVWRMGRTPDAGSLAAAPTFETSPKTGVPEKPDSVPGNPPARPRRENQPTMPAVPPIIPAPPAPPVPIDPRDANLPSAERREIGDHVALEKAPPTVLLQRQNGPLPWIRVRPGDRVRTAAYLVSLPGYRSELHLDRGVYLQLWGNVPEFSDFPPVLESTIMLHAPATGIDLDFTLDHGRVLLANTTKDGHPIQVRLRFHRETWELTLPDPRTRVAVELFGLYPLGVPFHPDAGGPEPTIYVGLFSQGEARLKVSGKEYLLPNKSQITWTNAGPPLAGPQQLPELPKWWTTPVDPKASSEVGGAMLDLQDFSVLIKSAKPDAIIDTVRTLVRDAAPEAAPWLGVLFLGAMDEPGFVFEALEDPRDSRVRNTAIQALRHWVSHHDERELFRTLKEKNGYSAENAEKVMRLLHDFSEADAGRPETYERLVALLGDDKLAIRCLAFWHLVRLVPEGAKIDYDPAEPGKRAAAVEAWKKLIAERGGRPGVK